MRTIQEIFNLVIDNGFYEIESKGYAYMCHSLYSAYKNGCIGMDEVVLATDAIESYMQGSEVIALVTALDSGLGKETSTFRDCLLVYKDWENRPELKFDN